MRALTVSTIIHDGLDTFRACLPLQVIDVSVIYGQHDSADHLLAGETKSSCSIALNNNLVLYLREATAAKGGRAHVVYGVLDGGPGFWGAFAVGAAGAQVRGCAR